jgi:hypothetical protein
MDNAIVNGQLHVVKWLHENSKEGYSKYIILEAAMNGNYHTVKWVHDNIHQYFIPLLWFCM